MVQSDSNMIKDIEKSPYSTSGIVFQEQYANIEIQAIPPTIPSSWPGHAVAPDISRASFPAAPPCAELVFVSCPPRPKATGAASRQQNRAPTNPLRRGERIP